MDRVREDVIKQIEAIRLKLLDMSKRNRLLNFRYRSGSIRIVDEVPGQVFDYLVRRGKAMAFLPLREDAEPGDESNEQESFFTGTEDAPTHDWDDELLLLNTSNAEVPEQSHDTLQTTLQADLLDTRLRRMCSDATSVIQETGSNHLFLAIGFLCWKERADSAESHEAPLVLVPVKIEKSKLNRKSLRYRYKIRYSGQTLVGNLSLREKLHREHGFDLPMFDEGSTADAVGDEESFDPEAYFRRVAEGIGGMSGWEVRPKMVVDLFAFAKQQMYRDLDPHSKDSGIADHDLILRLLGYSEHPTAGNTEHDAEETSANELLPLVLDADSSQTKAIRRALNGTSMVVQGPPGTGKSQTISNLIACLLAEGKSVLFVAEKMAALDIVFRNMERVGLSNFCLELHSHKTDKKSVIQRLKKIHAQRERFRKAVPGASGGDLARLKKARDSLGEYIELVKKPVGPGGEPVFDVFGKVERLRQKLRMNASQRQRLEIENAEALAAAQIEHTQDLIEQLSRAMCEMGVPYDTVWHGYRPVDLVSGDEEAVADILQQIRTAVVQMRKDANLVFEQMQASVHAEDMTYSQVQAICGLDRKSVPAGLMTDISGAILTSGDGRLWQEAEPWRLHIHDYRRNIQEASRFLKCPEGTASSDLTQLCRTAEVVKAYGLESLDLITIRELQDTITRLSSLLNAFQRLIALPVVTGLPEPRTLAEAAQFVQLESLVRRRPPQISGSALKKLLTPSLRVVFTRMMEEGQRLVQMRRSLDMFFALNDVCPPDELAGIRRALRGAGGWLRRSFSSEHRQAKQMLRSFMREPSQASRPSTVERLEALERLQAEEAAFVRSKDYIETFGESFCGLETDWEYIRYIVAWVTDVCAVCKSPALAETILTVKIDGQEGWPADGQVLHAVDEVKREFHRYVDIVSGLSGADALTPGKSEPIETLRTRLDGLGGVLTDLENWIAPEGFKKNAKLSDVLKAVESLVEAHAIRMAVETDECFKSLAGQHFKGVETDIDGIADTANWAMQIHQSGLPLGLVRSMAEGSPQELIGLIQEHVHAWAEDIDTVKAGLEALARFGSLDETRFLGKSLEVTSLGELEAQIDRAVSGIPLLLQWGGYCRLRERAHQAGLDGLVQKMETGELDPAHAVDAYVHAVYDAVARRVLRGYPQLATFSRIEYESKRKAFADLDVQLLKQHQQQIAYEAWCQPVPAGTSGTRVIDLSDLSLLRREFHKERRHLPIRQLINRAGDAIRALTPVFMMSPMSVAQFLDPGKHHFDVVVMDEASQIQPQDALGAIVRAEQMIVVGDSKQLPPTDFFTKVMDNPDDDDEEEMVFNSYDANESILTKCEQLQFPTESLLWHYRSEHESLIAFSNARWYDNELIIFPSSGISSTKLGIVYHYAEGATYASGKNVNEVEGEYVARKIIEHARKSPDLSLGVGTLNIKQRMLIEDMLTRFIREDPSAELSLEKLNEAHDGTEPLFIKNLENLQGDERDVIFISCTFGPDKDGRVYQRFGPLGYGDGWRRLNVLITRAKKRVEVFTSMRAEDITGEAGQEGRIALRDYLKYAETGVLPDYGYPDVRGPDSDFECAVAQVVRNLGYDVVPQVGVAGYFVDIGVQNPVRPGEYVLGIECDGAQYHSSIHARDRDRLREEVLRRRGWEIHRIWSTDWFKNREPEIARLKKRLEELVQNSTPRVVEAAEPKELKPPIRPVARPRLSDEELRGQIISYCQENIPRSEALQRIDGFLNPIVLEALVLYRITDKSMFIEYIPLDARTGLNSDDLQYLSDIFEIIEQGS